MVILHKRFKVLSFAFVGFVFTLFPISSYAQDTIAVVDVRMILAESKPAQNIQEQVQTYRDRFLKEVSAQEQALKQEHDKIVEESKTLDKAQVIEKRKAYEKKFYETL